MRELIRKILNEEVPSQVRRRIPTFEDTFKHYRNAFSKYTHRNFNIYWNAVIERVLETLYHAWFVNTVPDDDWEESEKYIQDYLTKKYKDKTKQMWEKKHHKRLNETGEDTKDIDESGKYTRAIKELVKIYEDEDFVCDIDAEYYEAAGAYIIIVRVDKKEMETYYENETIWYATERIRDYLGDLYRNIYREVKTYFPVELAVHIKQTKCSKKLNESEDNEEKTIQKNLIVLKKLISMFDYSEVCDMWVEYNSEDGDYEIRSKMSTKNHNTSALEKEFEFLENSIKSLGFTNCYVFRPYYVEQCEDEIKYMNESEDKNQSLLSLIEENGLYEIISSTGLHINEIEQKVGQFSREVLERFIIDVVKEHHTDIDEDGQTYILDLEEYFDVVPIGNNDYVVQLRVTYDKLFFLVDLYDEDEYGDLEYSSHEVEPSKNILYDNIYEIAGQLGFLLVKGRF